MLFPLNADYGQRKAKPQFLLQINFHVMQAELLELDAAEIMDVRRVPFHFLEHKFHLGLREHVLFVHANNARTLLELAGPAAPARPDAQSQVIDRQGRRGDHVEHADQCVHAIEFAAHVFAEHAALQVGQNWFGRFHRSRSNRMAH